MPRDEIRQLEFAERHLVFTQSFFPRIDAKVSALFAISSAEIAVAVLNVSPDDLKLWYVTVPLVAFLIVIATTVFNLYRCAYPHLEGGQRSLFYFAEIAKCQQADFIRDHKALTAAQLTDDLCGQIHRNAEILTLKYGYLKTATKAVMWSLLPWTALLLATSLSHWRAPLLGG